MIFYFHIFSCRLKTSDESGDDESQAKSNRKIDKDEVVCSKPKIFYMLNMLINIKLIEHSIFQNRLLQKRTHLDTNCSMNMLFGIVEEILVNRVIHIVMFKT